MNEIISKELLNLVLDLEIHEFKIIGDKDNVIFYHTKNAFMPMGDINIYELAHKCKEWCRKTHGYIVDSGYNTDIIEDEEICSNCLEVDIWEANVYKITITSQRDYIKKVGIFARDTEPEAIIKATEWVAKEKGLL